MLEIDCHIHVKSLFNRQGDYLAQVETHIEKSIAHRNQNAQRSEQNIWWQPTLHARPSK